MGPMSDELQRLREGLEVALPTRTVGALLFEALHHWGDPPPEGSAQVRAFAEGPLRALLVRLPNVDVDALLTRVLAVPKTRRALDSTREVPVLSTVVPVLVLAGSTALATRIAVALGPQRVAVFTAATSEDFASLVSEKRPAMVIVDSAVFPAIEPAALPFLLDALPSEVTRAVTGIDTPYGAAVLAELAQTAVACTTLDRREGIEPVLDLIRSRRKAIEAKDPPTG